MQLCCLGVRMFYIRPGDSRKFGLFGRLDRTLRLVSSSSSCVLRMYGKIRCVLAAGFATRVIVVSGSSEANTLLESLGCNRPIPTIVNDCCGTTITHLPVAVLVVPPSFVLP